MRYAKRIAALTAAATVALTGATALATTASAAPAAQADAHGFQAFVGPLHHVSTVASTVPGNGDVNPYGMAVAPRTTGGLTAGNILISNFNDAKNEQGTGTTIVEVAPSGRHWVFASIARHLRGCPGGVGLTTALVALRGGWVIVGSLPTSDGTSAHITGAGCLIVLDSNGMVRETFAGHGINGPWDMTALDLGALSELFVTNVLNGTKAANGATVHRGTVLRLIITSGSGDVPRLLNVTRIGSGFGEHTDPAALVIGPTGVGLGRNGTLYVADTVASRIAAIPDATTRFSDDGTGSSVTQGGALKGELGLVIAPNGDILTANAGNGDLVETTPSGVQIAVRHLDRSGSPPGSGALFGLVLKPGHRAVYFVDDATNTLDVLR